MSDTDDDIFGEHEQPPQPPTPATTTEPSLDDDLDDGDIFSNQGTPKLEISGGESSEEPSIITLDPPSQDEEGEGDEDDLFGGASPGMQEKKSHPDDDVDIFGEKDGGGSCGKLFAEVQPSGACQSKSQIVKNDICYVDLSVSRSHFLL